MRLKKNSEAIMVYFRIFQKRRIMKNNKTQQETEHKSRWSIISNVAVIISLIFVIFELRQNHKALEEANTIARMESATTPTLGQQLFVR